MYVFHELLILSRLSLCHMPRAVTPRLRHRNSSLTSRGLSTAAATAAPAEIQALSLCKLGKYVMLIRNARSPYEDQGWCVGVGGPREGKEGFSPCQDQQLPPLLSFHVTQMQLRSHFHYFRYFLVCLSLWARAAREAQWGKGTRGEMTVLQWSM